MDHPYTYMFIRQDLSIPQQIVQSNHAALEAGFEFKRPADTSSMIVIGCKDEAELHEISKRLHRYNIDHVMFFEPDFGPMGHTAICTRPLLTTKERSCMRKYSLYSESNNTKVTS